MRSSSTSATASPLERRGLRKTVRASPSRTATTWRPYRTGCNLKLHLSGYANAGPYSHHDSSHHLRYVDNFCGEECQRDVGFILRGGSKYK